MARTRVRPVAVVVLAAAIVAGPGRAALGGSEPAAGDRPATRHVVRPGDTLWGIARAAVGPEGDPRPMVERIREANAMAPSEPLLPGTALVVPGP